MSTIMQWLVNDGRFNTLVSAIQAANLADTLNSTGPFTVFAPLDSAFAALPEERLAGLLRDVAALTRVLTYHVVAGRFEADAIVAQGSAASVEGAALAFSRADAAGRVNEARIAATNIAVDNGVIHIIEAVLLPPEAQGRDVQA